MICTLFARDEGFQVAAQAGSGWQNETVSLVHLQECLPSVLAISIAVYNKEFPTSLFLCCQNFSSPPLTSLDDDLTDFPCVYFWPASFSLCLWQFLSHFRIQRLPSLLLECAQ